MEELDDELMVPAHLIDLAASTTIIRALRGDRHPDAALANLEPFAPDTDPQVAALATLARAWIALLGRHFGSALRLANDAAAASIGFNRNAALVLGVRAALWADRPDAADELLETLKSGQPKGRAIQAAIRSLEGGLAARRARPKLAAARYRSAFKAWQQLDLPVPHVLGLI